MPRARKHLVNLNDTPYYHVTSRCVRRAYLCGDDRETGKNYEHRRHWLEQRIRLLSSIFAVDLCAYAVMSNHYHIVLKLVPEEATFWTEQDVLNRWCCLFKGTRLVQRYRDGDPLTQIELENVVQTVAVYRKRLTNLSWFMKCLNEPIARMANAEDGCTGHFWEARFTSQAILTDQALLAGMVYVDLNPVRANMSSTPERSAFTSIKERLNPRFDLQQAINDQLVTDNLENIDVETKPLTRFRDQVERTEKAPMSVLPFKLEDYLQLLDTTGRLVRPGKRGVIDSAQPPILQRLSISLSKWERYSTQFERLHRRGEFRLASSS